ncbi:MAG TPA: MarR family transcriptional regulator [Mycobacteriales bacterium]|nr:MarR family transcriptional regulator [Mycobacteriales bacterium]
MGSTQEQVLHELEAALRAASKRVYATTSRQGSIRGHRIDRAGYAALSVIDENTELRLSEVASCLELDLSTVSRQVRQLEDAGLVRRRPDPLDGRASLLTLSPEGRRVLAAVRAARVDLLAHALREWRSADRAELLRLLQRLLDDLTPAEARTPLTRTSLRGTA